MARPLFVLTDEHVRQIEYLAGIGLTLPKIAAFLEISESTLQRRKKEERRVLKALERGKAKAEGAVGKALFNRATDGDVAAIRWWEMTRAGRSEASRKEITGKDGEPLNLTMPQVVIIEGADVDDSED